MLLRMERRRSAGGSPGGRRLLGGSAGGKEKRRGLSPKPGPRSSTARVASRRFLKLPFRAAAPASLSPSRGPRPGDAFARFCFGAFVLAF